jgi:HK97 gp10 family phage protein
MSYESRIPEIVARMEAGAQRVVTRTGLRIEAGAKQRSRWKTGYMRRAIRFYPNKMVENPKWIFDEETGAMTKLDPDCLIDAGMYAGEVVGGASYTIYNEMGTVHMSAQPMFGPATEEVRPIYIAEMEEMMRRAVHG